MSFKKDIPNYKTLQSEKYNLTTVDKSIWIKIEAYAQKISENVSELIHITNALAEIALVTGTTNWGWDFVANDLSGVIHALEVEVKNGKFYMLMDAIATIAEIGCLDIDDVEELLVDYNLGYCIEKDTFTKKYHWVLREDVSSLTERIEETQELIKSGFEQALEHFEQAKKQLENAGNERARKDAVRDCASAMESIIKILGNDNDIKNASKKLRDEKQWGEDTIVKDGDAIFNTIHRLYSDVRHGSTEMSEMSIEAAQYWVDRITAYINYMLRMNENII